MTESGENVAVSRREVAFRNGLLCWTAEDTFDVAIHHIGFRLLEGDIAVFDGSWTCADVGDDTAVTFAARLDLGIPSLADALEPIAGAPWSTTPWPSWTASSGGPLGSTRSLVGTCDGLSAQRTRPA